MRLYKINWNHFGLGSLIWHNQKRKDYPVESEHIKGAANKVVGKIKEETGDALDDKSLELKGKAQQVKGDVQNAVGDAKDAVE